MFKENKGNKNFNNLPQIKHKKNILLIFNTDKPHYIIRLVWFILQPILV